MSNLSSPSSFNSEFPSSFCEDGVGGLCQQEVGLTKTQPIKTVVPCTKCLVFQFSSQLLSM